jgi:predicted nucleic acid-binding protein
LFWNLQELLPKLLDDVWVSPAVMEELSALAAPDEVREFVHSPPPWLRIRRPLPLAQSISAALDRGEREALALACELSADLVLVDDAAARREAKSLGFRITETIGILRLGAERDMIDVPATVSRLRASGMYLDEKVVQSAFGPWL